MLRLDFVMMLSVMLSETLVSADHATQLTPASLANLLMPALPQTQAASSFRMLTRSLHRWKMFATLSLRSKSRSVKITLLFLPLTMFSVDVACLRWRERRLRHAFYAWALIRMRASVTLQKMTADTQVRRICNVNNISSVCFPSNATRHG
jgi:hypothetical protein